MEEEMIQMLKNQEIIMRYLKLMRNYECNTLDEELHVCIKETKEIRQDH